jgi:carbon storage regulator
MLIISRKREEKIIVADEIEITILEISRNRVRFGIKAPKRIPIQTRLTNTPIPADAAETAENKGPISPLEGLPAAVGLPKPR